jgi:diguanylate cyclase (GGDEF)-like protein
MELKLYFQMMKRGWWIIVLSALSALALSLAASYFAVPQYRATARFVIVPNALLTNGPDVVRGLDALNSVTVVSTYAEIMNSERVYVDTLSLLKLQRQDVKDYTYQASVLPNTSILDLSVTGPNPKLAAVLANSIGYQTIQFAAGMNQPFDINFLDKATEPTIPVSPQPLQDAGVAFALGLVGGAALVLIREQIRIPLEAYRQRLRMDSVTGVYNRQFFPRLLEEQLAASPNELLSLGFIELSGLQDIIETLPMASLHWILQRVTDLLRKELRGHDVIGRWSDVSFIVMLPNTSAASANRIFERIFQSLSAPLHLAQLGLTVNLDPHVGGAEYSNKISTQELLGKAGEALEQARRDSTTPIYVWMMNNPFWAR